MAKTNLAEPYVYFVFAVRINLCGGMLWWGRIPIVSPPILLCYSLEEYFAFKAAFILRQKRLLAPTKFVPLFVQRNLVRNPVEHKNLWKTLIMVKAARSMDTSMQITVVTMHTNKQIQRFAELLPTVTLNWPAKSEAA